MRSVIFWCAAAVAAASASVALAAGFGISTTDVGAGDTPIVVCDSNGFTVSFTTSRGLVTAVTVSGIADPACEGGSLAVTVTNSAGDSIAMAGPTTVPTDGDAADNSMTMTTSAQPGAAQVAGYHVSITGP
ncbi:MAG: hypothetical protein ACRDOF_03385 [Gaiellaceae bacterium]